jgi:hypothetical protein
VSVASGIQVGGANDGQAYGLRQTRELNLKTAASMPSLFELVRDGRVFTGNAAAAGFVLPIYSNTTQQFSLWDPVGSGVDLVILRISMSYIDTTGAAGGYVLGYLPNAPAAIGTGLAITAFTETAPINNYLGSGRVSKAKFAQGSTITVTAPSILRHLGLNQNAFTANGTGQMFYRSDYEFGFGDVVLTPGSALFLAGNIALLAKAAPTIVWAEIDRV